MTIEKDCDDLILDVYTYKTIVYGCCGSEDELAIYDYQNKLIIDGDEKILIGDIPNSDIKLFAPWKNFDKDPKIRGTLYFCYNNEDRYAVKIKNSLLTNDCSEFSPDILINTENSQDTYNKYINEYQLWSLDKIENKNQINNLQLKIAFDCDKTTKALIIRTLPNSTEKLTVDYSSTNPPYMDVQCIDVLNEAGVEHLLLDLPSVDRESDNGVLAMHHAFWQVPENPQFHKTITELIFVPNEVPDGNYLLSLQVAPFENDASPSRPVLYAVK
ncbi:MAG: cyclase family protein [Brumimicrobium sp.]|nr:cyclase family protein [Brumimicrobium sp.]